MFINLFSDFGWDRTYALIEPSCGVVVVVVVIILFVYFYQYFCFENDAKKKRPKTKRHATHDGDSVIFLVEKKLLLFFVCGRIGSKVWTSSYIVQLFPVNRMRFRLV